jgi:hypothetical protein
LEVIETDMQLFNNQTCPMKTDVPDTKWKEFLSPNFSVIKPNFMSPVIFDGRNRHQPALIKDAGIGYHGIGR